MPSIYFAGSVFAGSGLGLLPGGSDGLQAIRVSVAFGGGLEQVPFISRSPCFIEHGSPSTLLAQASNDSGGGPPGPGRRGGGHSSPLGGTALPSCCGGLEQAPNMARFPTRPTVATIVIVLFIRFTFDNA